MPAWPRGWRAPFRRQTASAFARGWWARSGVDDLLALGKAESDELVRRAAAVRNGMTALFGALVGAGETPARRRRQAWRRCGNRWGEPGTRPPVRWTEARRGRSPRGILEDARGARGGGDGDTAAGRPGGSRR